MNWKSFWGAIPVLLALPTNSAASPQGGGSSASWPQYGFDAAQTGYNPNETRIDPGNVDDLQMAWTRGSSSTIRNGVMVAGGIAYYGTYGGQYFAVDMDTGATRWSGALSGKHNGHAIVDGVVYVTGNNGGVYAFDATSGATLWNWTHGGSGFGSIVASDGILLVTSGSPDELNALDLSTGTKIWGATPRRAAAVADGVVYSSLVGATGNTFEVLDLATGNLLWASTAGAGSVLSRPAVSGGLVYVHSDAGSLYVFDANGCGGPDCVPLWSGVMQPDVAEGPQEPAVANGVVYAGSAGVMHAFDASGCGQPTCSPLWTTATSCTFFNGHPPSVANGVTYSVCGNSYLYAFDAAAGGSLWQFYTAGSGYPMRSSPTIVDGMLFHSATFSFTLYAFELPPLLASTTTRNGTGVNVPCFTNVTPPTLGGIWTSRVDHQHHHGASSTIVVAYGDGVTGPVIRAGEILLDLTSPKYFTHTVISSLGGANLHSIPVPNEVSLSGFNVATQALILGGGRAELCNAIDLVLGA